MGSLLLRRRAERAPMRGGPRLVVASLCGALAGILTRPCCIVPVVLSLAGVSAAGAVYIVAAYRPLFLTGSALMLGASMWITFRRDGGWLTKAIAAAATCAGFVVSGAWTGVL